MSSNQSASSTLGVPELLQEVGKYLTASELRSAVQVCKTWHTSVLPLTARDVYISYPQEVLPSFDLLARNSWRTETITVVGRPRTYAIPYFGIRGCIALKKFTWKSEEPWTNAASETQWAGMVGFVRENRAAMESITIEYRSMSWMGFWMTLSHNPIPHLASLSLRKSEISADSALYFWAVCRHLEILELRDCSGLRYLRPLSRDVRTAAVALRSKLGGGSQSLPSLGQLEVNENFMFPQMKVLKLPAGYDGDGWTDLMEQCPKLEAW